MAEPPDPIMPRVKPIRTAPMRRLDIAVLYDGRWEVLSGIAELKTYRYVVRLRCFCAEEKAAVWGPLSWLSHLLMSICIVMSRYVNQSFCFIFTRFTRCQSSALCFARCEQTFLATNRRQNASLLTLVPHFPFVPKAMIRD